MKKPFRTIANVPNGKGSAFTRKAFASADAALVYAKNQRVWVQVYDTAKQHRIF